MSTSPRMRERFYLLPTIAYFINAAINVGSRGWRDTVWVGWALMGIGFLFVGRLPDDIHKRKSFRKMLRDPFGIVIAAVLIAGLILIAVPLMRPHVARYGQPTEQVIQTGTDAVSRFHNAVSEERFGDVCRNAEPNTFRSITGLPCSEFLKYVHEHFGEVVDSKRTQMLTIGDRLGYPIGLELSYTTRYKRGEVRERFAWRVYGSKVSLMRYNCDWDVLPQ